MPRRIPGPISLCFHILGLACLSTVIFAGWAQAASLVRDVEFSARDLRVWQVAGEAQVSLNGAVNRAHPGDPDLPYASATLEVPAGTHVTGWKVTPLETIEIPGQANLRAAPAWSRSDGRELSAPRSAAFHGASWFPEQPFENPHAGALQGHEIVTLALRPLQYLPSEQRLRLIRRFRVELTVESGATAPLARLRRTDRTEQTTRRALSVLGLDYQARPNARVGQGGAFPAAAGESPGAFGKEAAYVIITADSLVSAFQPLANWKIRQGISAKIVPLSTILASYPQGVDVPEKVRMYARDSYLYQGTVWLLLGGDASIIPPRFAHSTLLGGENIPADCYFGNLDGNWDANSNSIFGEAYEDTSSPGDSVDFYPELYVGRAPCANTTQATTFVNKTLLYDQNPPQDYLNNQLLFAEVLFPSNYVPNQGIIFDGTLVSEEVKDSLPAYNHFVRLYENNNQTNFPGSIYEDWQSVTDSLNVGYNLALHVGHGFRNTMSVGGGTLVNADMRALHNSPRNSYLVSLDCTSGAIDFDCIGAASVNNPNGGAFAFWGSTREAFPAVCDNYMGHYFFLANTDSISEIGEDLALCKLPYVYLTASDYPDRWTQYAFILFGDPGLRFRTRVSSPLIVNSAASFTMGDPGYTLTVTTTGGVPVPGATVCVNKSGDDLAAGTTDGSGSVTLPFQPDSAGPFQITATMRNYLPYMGTANVVARSGAYLFDYTPNKIVFDGTFAPQNGNGNGVIDAGEAIQLGVVVGNNGGIAASGVSGTLSTSQAGVAFSAPTVGYGTISSHSSFPGSGYYALSFSRELRDGLKVPFNLHLTDSAGDTHDDYFTLPVRAPKAEHYSHVYSDSVAGLTHYTVLRITVRNLGSGAFRGLTGTVRPVSGAFLPVDSTSSYGNLAPGASWIGTKEFRFQGQASPLSRFYLFLTDAYGHTDTLDFDLQAPGAPSGLTGTGGQSTIALSWSASPDSNTVKGYYIYRSSSQVGPFTRSNSVLTGRISYYQDSGLQPLTPYYYYVTAVDSGGNEGAQSTIIGVSTNPPNHLGWPIGTGHEMPGSPALLNFDHSGDGSLEIVQGSDAIYIWRADGTELRDGDGQPLTSGVWVPRGSYYPASVATADLFGNGKFEIVGVTQDSLKVIVWDENGNVLPGWPQQLLGGFPFGTPAIGDIDGDGQPEIVVGCGSRFYAWHANGTEVRDGDNDPSTNGVFAVVGGSFIYGSPALADLDRDGKADIILGSGDGLLHAFKYTGAECPGFPYATGGAITGSAAVADLDLSGHLSVVFPSTDNKLYALSDAGVIRAGWPVVMALGNTSRSPSPALADLNGDGYLDVVEATTDGYMRALNRNGTDLAGWTNVRYAAVYAATGAGSSESSPIVADVNGDGQLEVLEGAEDATLYGFTNVGTPLAGFPIRLGGAIRGTPSVFDLTNTGKINIVVPCWDRNVYLWDYPGTFNRSKMPWAMFRHDDSRTGLYSNPNLVTAVGDAQLEAEAGPEGIRLTWLSPSAPGGRVTWNVYRREDASAAAGDGGVDRLRPLTDIPSDFALINGSPLAARDGGGSSFLDQDVRGGHSYVYILETLVDGHRLSLTGPLARNLPAQFLPAHLALFQNTPNPFRSETAIRYQVPAGKKGSALQPQHVRLTVHDVTGRLVRTLADGAQAPGSYSALWDGKDQEGSALSSGVYFYRLVGPDGTLTRKIMLVR